MLKEVLYKMYKDPVGLLARTMNKIIIAPFKYGRDGGYDAQKYWGDRFSKYGETLRASGDEGLSEEENLLKYKQASDLMVSLLHREKINLEQTIALEIGCGTGFYTQLLHDLSVMNYVGVDITDALFPELRQKYLGYQFIKKDVTTEEIGQSSCDLILMIDVIQHIVNEDRLAYAMKSVQQLLARNGIFILAPLMTTKKKHLFYLHSWKTEDIRKYFPEDEYLFSEGVPFKDNTLLVIRNIK